MCPEIMGYISTAALCRLSVPHTHELHKRSSLRSFRLSCARSLTKGLKRGVRVPARKSSHRQEAVHLAANAESFSAPSLFWNEDVSRLVDTGLDICTVSDIKQAALGLQVWRRALKEGRLPEFGSPDAATGAPSVLSAEAALAPWPPEPLHSQFCTALCRLNMPRFTQRHPQLVDTVMRHLLDLAAEFLDAREELGEESPSAEALVETGAAAGTSAKRDAPTELDLGELAAASQQLVDEFISEFSPAIGALGELDALFGSAHGLLSADDEALAKEGVPGGEGFGLGDGVWVHTGWRTLRELQHELRDLRELKALIRSLGRHSEVNGVLRRSPPTTAAREAPPGVSRSPLEPTEVASLCRSGALDRMLPSEAMLLAVGKQEEQPMARAARRMFLAKAVEQDLLTYDLSGWVAETARVLPNKNVNPYRPIAPGGGPLIICLDTSWSMEGQREMLAKAVVVETVRAAHAQQRGCFLFAFAAGSQVAACELGASKQGIQQLLAFLSGSFRGGTDVTSPLREAMDRLEDPSWANSDVLLVSDGELQMPPLKPPLMARLQALRAERGVELHGLLIGKMSSDPLSAICDHVHVFLAEWEAARLQAAVAGARSSKAAQLSCVRRVRSSPRLRYNSPACRSPFGGSMLPLVNRGFRHHVARRTARTFRCRRQCLPDGKDERISNEMVVSFGSSLEAACEQLQAEAAARTAAAMATLEEEATAQVHQAPGKTELLEPLLSSLSQGLVQREVEVGLLLLAALCGEHLLLLGPPGTAKSELGRRLATRCGGAYFERLLTRFTTPEELFGPLSLSALEQDK
ncbi:hypothetical protein CYMTET_36757, partial [Cymbomonas tetramitiformis]